MSALGIAKEGVMIMSLVICMSTSEITFADCPADFGSTIPESYTALPPLFFIEEWDNGFTGNELGDAGKKIS